MLKILTIVGARPQFIKAAAISHAIRSRYAGRIQEDLLHTGQHYDPAMSGQFFAELDLPQPRYNLGIGSASHAVQTARMLEGIAQVLTEADAYDGVVVYGDTNSTLAGALAAAQLHVPVYHIEAGLRSFNRAMPEETNRVLTDHLSALLFAPTRTAVAHLRHEGFAEESICLSGDVMLDNVRHYAPTPKADAEPIILATLHRNFNTDSPERLQSILSALDAIGAERRLPVVLPCHPRTRKRIEALGLQHRHPRLQLAEPLAYRPTLEALGRARMVLTDSGGLQKEAYFCGRPCVILRPETEWTEIVDAGAAMTADADPSKITAACNALWNRPIAPPDQFGDGHAAEHILEAILAHSKAI